MSDAPLPEVYEGFMDAPTLAAYLDDLERCTELLDVLAKDDATVRTDGRAQPLREAARRLTTGELRGVQVRYRYQGSEWRDTLLWTPGGLKCVRMPMPW